MRAVQMRIYTKCVSPYTYLYVVTFLNVLPQAVYNGSAKYRVHKEHNKNTLYFTRTTASAMSRKWAANDDDEGGIDERSNREMREQVRNDE